MNATGTFFSVLLAHYIYKNDRLTFNKIIGCALGFAGVMVVNFWLGLDGLQFFSDGRGLCCVGCIHPFCRQYLW